MKEMFQEYVKNRTLSNWKFWIVSFLNYIIHIIHSHSTTVIQMIRCLIVHVKLFDNKTSLFLDKSKFSTIIQGLFDTYNNMVSTASIDELCRTTLAWLDQHCSLVVLRPGKFIQHVRCTWKLLVYCAQLTDKFCKIWWNKKLYKVKNWGKKSPSSIYMCPSVISHIISFYGVNKTN